MSDQLPEVVRTGDRLRSLEVLRDHLAVTAESAPPQYVAALAKQLAAVMEEIATLRPPKEANAVDEIEARREARRKAAATPKRAAGGVKRGSRSR